MELRIQPAAPKRSNQVSVFLSDGARQRLDQLAGESGHPPGRVASLIVERALEEVPTEPSRGPGA